MTKPAITWANDFHHDASVVSLRFEKDFTFIAKVKTLNGAAWSQSRGFWYIRHGGFKHGFAAHKPEQGMELRFIHELPGRESSKTTEIYTRVSRNSIKKMRNLLDDLEI